MRTQSWSSTDIYMSALLTEDLALGWAGLWVAAKAHKPTLHGAHW
jgi:hypothetical protein